MIDENVRYAEKINELVALVNDMSAELAEMRKYMFDLQDSPWFRLYLKYYAMRLPPKSRPVKPMDIPPVLPAEMREPQHDVVTLPSSEVRLALPRTTVEMPKRRKV